MTTKTLLSSQDIDQFARTVLLGTTLEEKLAGPNAFQNQSNRSVAPFAIPKFPGRPKNLLNIGTAKFPNAAALKGDTARGQVLHFFANHELLALELMALVLLKFPTAPEEFRAGLVRTIEEEQAHMRLYIQRMQELGVEFGDLPLSDFFWNTLKETSSPLEFVTQMSLTFEQANLDFCIFYRDAVREFDDTKTAKILEKVYQDEIGHVKNGLIWFNRWRDQTLGESDWQAYKRMLPPPLTVRRAKGLTFLADVRREIGFSEEFIAELEINAGSKGRPPTVWHYNPSCDAEIVRGKPGLSVPKHIEELAQDLEPLVIYLSHDSDVIWARKRPELNWMREITSAGILVPEFVTTAPTEISTFSGFEPWGWSPAAVERFMPMREKLVGAIGTKAAWQRSLLQYNHFSETKVGALFSKVWSARFFKDWLAAHPSAETVFGPQQATGGDFSTTATICSQAEQLLAHGKPVALKAPYGTAGNGVKRVSSTKDFTPQLLGWIENTVKQQGSLVVEPWLGKLHDLSMQIEILTNEEGTHVKLYEAREFLTDSQAQYKGTLLDKKFSTFTPNEHRLFHTALPIWQHLARDLGRALFEAGYQGPAGIDAMLWQDDAGQIYFKPLVELNPRWTMGRVALELEKHIVPGTTAKWLFFQKSAHDWQAIKTQYPLVFTDGENGRRIKSGVLFTTDPNTSKHVVTVLAVGTTQL